MVIHQKCRDTLLKVLQVDHPGISRMNALDCCHIWWLNLDSDIEMCVRNCVMHQDKANMSQTKTPDPWELSGRAWFLVYLFSASPINGKQILVMVDVHC